ncbi:hypothetical protein FO497_06565 [Bacillus cereus ATCC 10876]|uniref:hypothetical protein n=1 Tax=Bacillus TaxID=1386 RepID=UPI00019FF148|nr:MULTISPECIES: hypothetical protein [Bacillus]MDJ0281971.1 hypothetical protein [Bacillus bombysepticus]EEK47386.1 hypothetical protein bcere0002_56370 [Bacillus cereus ATCC 10876]KFL63349.1 hypothetical protein DJ50_4765 [Bacillus cereus ATCC 10876]MBO1129576.1 hypothetical protein [Bacillus cereus]MDF9545769.1 hypothetical protein [Bacillus cereus]
MAEEKKDNKNRLDFLYKAIDDTQNTIRFTDTKAGAVVVFWTLVLNIILRKDFNWYLSVLTTNNWVEQLVVVILTATLIYFFAKSVWMVYMTLVPRINPREHIDTTDFDAQHLFFLSETVPGIEGKYLYSNYGNPKMKISAKEYYDKLTNLDSEGVEKELIIELQKVSYIRNVKLARANVAITAVVYSLITVTLLVLYLTGNKFFTQ